MKPDFSTVLEMCLEKIRQGKSLDDCLQLYPQHAQALLPLLRAAEQAQRVASIQPAAEAVEAGRLRMLAAARQQVRQERIRSRGMQPILRFALYLVMVAATAGLMTINAAARSLPGDRLYGVKRDWEQVRLNLVAAGPSRADLEASFNRERFAELDRMVAQRRAGTVTLEGVVESIRPNEWVVDGLHVLVTPQTLLDVVPTIGARLTLNVQVRGDGSLLVLVASSGSTQSSEPSEDVDSTETPEPGSEQEPTETAEPPGGEEPPETEEPGSGQEPTETVEPVGTQEPTDNEDPVGTQEPTNNEDSPDFQDPAAEQGSSAIQPLPGIFFA